MKLSVEIITGTFIDTVVSENATVKQLKEKISTEVKLPVRRLILVFGNEEERRMLMDDEDEIMLRDLGMREDSHMYLFIKNLDLVSMEERSLEGDDVSMEEISSEAESRRRENEEDEKVKIDGEDEDKQMKNEEEEEKEKDREDTKDDDNAEEEAREVEELGDEKEET
ncbi:unnamed protein product [Arabis nemorensis]|uniref:Ubiquitin-like domain-containing protein n=1 Tax=Arabis nemorensis TaxID=586526 RepID=A0A565C1G0_9BRAS|nr:unnamed protein product [Arabis nemorensis]